MTSITKTDETIENLERYMRVYFSVVCDAAIISGIQPPILISDASRARMELPKRVVELIEVFECVKNNTLAVEIHERIINLIRAEDYGDAEKIAERLAPHCKTFFAYAINQ